MVPYVDAVVAVSVMRVLLFVLHVCLLRECGGARLTAMLEWGMDDSDSESILHGTINAN